MKNTEKLFWKSVIGVTITVATLGFIIPFLISQNSDIAVGTGYAIGVAWLWLILFKFGIVGWLGGFVQKIKAQNLLMLLCAALMLTQTGCSRVPPGNVGVKVYLLGGSKGVNQEELGVGRYWIGMNEELFVFPTFTQNYVWTKSPQEGSPNDESITFQTVDGMEVNGDFGITYRIDPTKVSILFQTYRKGVEEITDIFLRNIVRDELNKASSKLKIEEIYGVGKEALMTSVKDKISKAVEEKGIIVENIYVIGSFRLPPTVQESLNLKIAASQKAAQRENEIQEATAEAAKKVAEAQGIADSILLKAKADAEANTMLAKSVTPELVQYQTITKWNGELPQFVGGGTIPMIQMLTTNR
jgi:regulator of protease activity HflC (stomatin/prohibitin superfamily)